MKQIIFDTSFIISAVRNKIDIFNEILEYEILIPTQVIGEIKRLKNPNSELTLKILEKNRFKEINLGSGHVDKLIINFAANNPKTIVATLDREIKKKVKNHKMVIRAKNKLEIV